MHPSELLPHLQQRARFATRVAKRRLGHQAAGGDAVDRFHQLYYESEVFGGTWMNTYWLGVPIWKCPFDLWVYQELLHDQRPGLVIETGTAWGGSALFLASMFDLIGHGSVLSIDLRPRNPRPAHPRIRYVTGSSTDPAIVALAARAAAEAGGTLVLLDSDHSCAHVRQELQLYSPMVRVGGYVVVEDTNVNGHPVRPDFGPGPMEAVDQFLAAQDGFVVEREMEKFHMTMNPRGFLRRVR